jgi:hypothetical protein
MFIKSSGADVAFDAVICTKVQLAITPGGWSGSLGIAFIDSASGAVWGSSAVQLTDVAADSEIKTALLAFIDAVEKDYGAKLFDRGFTPEPETSEDALPENTGMAESSRGLGGR